MKTKKYDREFFVHWIKDSLIILVAMLFIALVGVRLVIKLFLVVGMVGAILFYMSQYLGIGDHLHTGRR